MNIVTPAPSLQAYAGTSLTFSTSFAIGNGVLSAYYLILGKLIFVQISLCFGSTTTASGVVRVTMPAGITIDRQKMIAGYSGTSAGCAAGASFRDDSAVADYYMSLVDSGNSSYLFVKNSLSGQLSATSPATMAVNDTICISGWIPIV